MKKLTAILAALAILFSVAALAENLAEMTDEELLELNRNVKSEMARRGLPDTPETNEEQHKARERVLTFFMYWNRNDLDEMLTLCDPAWKERKENPKTELFRILQNRTPLSLTVESINEIAGESYDGRLYCLVYAVSEVDRNNGKATEKYLFRILTVQGKDGLWYIIPDSLEDSEKADDEFPAEATPEPAAMEDMELYYQPDGGEYYHLDQNCRRVHAKYLPLQGVFHYSELNDENYRDLKSCQICGAPQRPEN